MPESLIDVATSLLVGGQDGERLGHQILPQQRRDVGRILPDRGASDHSTCVDAKGRRGAACAGGGKLRDRAAAR